MTYKIAVAGLHIESSSFNPGLTRTADFRILRGADLFNAPDFAMLADYDADWQPVFWARAVPGAPICPETYAAFKAEILAGIRAAMPLDGVYMALHGAAVVAGMHDCEGDLLAAVRDIVGPDVLITTSYDLHGNVSDRVVDSIDMFSAYRTAPHIDVPQTMRRAIALLMRALDSGQRPSVCWVKVPVLLPGERTSTEDEPAASLYAVIPALEDVDGIWDVSLMVGYVWVDEPRATAAVLVTGTDHATMQRAAIELASAYWDARESFVFGTVTGSLSDCLSMARDATALPVVLADSGDNPTGGGAGDRADTLAALLENAEADVILAGIADLPLVDAAYGAGVGASVHGTIGATHDPINSAPLPITAQVIALSDAPRAAERQAVLRCDGVTFVVTARRRPFHNLVDFTSLGLDPAKARMVVVKSGYLSPDMKALAATSLMALTPGIVDQDVTRRPRQHIARPTFPFDTGFDWAPHVLWSARDPAGSVHP
ncbi:Microcystin LR degradation protein MlrC-like protein [Ketogulonicigenium robustum]|uniref:Microcystinase C n=1 Tax=Ketogulonicigenium robustum TaxID=92947 RepID=A0A1W6P001_9RHOB|nr:M81 family metallopeptidase [Ketogulonicigenium robustum]ARO14597.1 Microcystin LR degradation protein MlrC-like protein [Ketogulonicigenium robustum]